jgi:RNA polymerase sigma factor (sigma-70 family)
MSTEPIARQGLSEEEFFQAFTQREKQLRGYAYRQLGCKDAAEEAFQETFIACWTRLQTYTEQGTFNAWIFRIMHNKCQDALQARRTLYLFQEHSCNYQDKAGDVVENLERRELLEIVRTALGQLDKQSREMLLLRVEELSRAEIASTLELSEKAVGTRLFRARNDLFRRCCELAPSFAQHVRRSAD